MGDKCRSCGASIRWVLMNPSGRPMPVDMSHDDERGNIAVFSAGRDRLLGQVVSRERAEEEGIPLYTSHFATCPQASAWRGGRGDE